MCREIQITACTYNLFINRFPVLHLNIFIPNVFNKGNLPGIQDKNILCLAFNLAKESVSSKKCSQVIQQNCEQNLVKRETKI